MKYVPSAEVVAKEINYDGLDTRVPWVISDGTLEYFDTKFLLQDKTAYLDIGCGNGMVLQHYQKPATTLHGIDLNNYLDDSVSDQVQFAQVDINFDALPYEDASLDVVLALQVVEHLENPLLVMREAHRVLKADGLFVMSMPNPFTIPSKLRFLFTDNVLRWRENNDHLFFMTTAVFKKTYGAYFDVIEVRHQKGVLPLAGRLLGLLGIKFNKESLKLLPRSKHFAKSTCYLLRKKR